MDSATGSIASARTIRREGPRSLDNDPDQNAEHGGADFEELNALELIHLDLLLEGFLKTVLTEKQLRHRT
jgi:hypothetical protein